MTTSAPSFRSTDDTAAAFQAGAGAFYRGEALKDWADSDYGKGWVAAALAQRGEIDERIEAAVARARAEAQKAAPPVSAPLPEPTPGPLLALLRDGTLRNLAEAAKRLAGAFAPGVGGKPHPPYRQRLLAETEAVADAVLERLDRMTTPGLSKTGLPTTGRETKEIPGRPQQRSRDNRRAAARRG